MINAILIGDKAAVERVKRIGKNVEPRVKSIMSRLAIKLSAKVKAHKLSGQVLKNRTGRLRRSINWKLSGASGNIEASVGTNVEYARVHEYGFSGSVSVKAHMRKVKSRNKRGFKGVGFVRAHTKQVNYPERSFLRSALGDMRGEIFTKLNETMRGIGNE